MFSFGPSAAVQRKRFDQWKTWQEQQDFARQFEAYQRDLAEWERQQAQPPQTSPPYQST